MKQWSFIRQCCFGLVTLFWLNLAVAGKQAEEPLANSVRSLVQRNIADTAPPSLVFDNAEQGQAWRSCIGNISLQ